MSHFICDVMSVRYFVFCSLKAHWKHLTSDLKRRFYEKVQCAGLEWEWYQNIFWRLISEKIVSFFRRSVYIHGHQLKTFRCYWYEWNWNDFKRGARSIFQSYGIVNNSESLKCDKLGFLRIYAVHHLDKRYKMFERWSKICRVLWGGY